MATKISDKIINLVSEGETEKGLELLRDYLKENSPKDKTHYHATVLLLGKYNKFENERRLGLEPDPKRLNQIEYNLLRIVDDVKAGKTASSYHGTQQNYGGNTGKSQAVRSGSGSPVLWILATLGGLFIVAIIIGLAMEDPPPQEQTLGVDPTETQVAKDAAGQTEPKTQKTEIPPAVEPEEADDWEEPLTGIDDGVIRNLLANTRWYQEANNVGLITFNETGTVAAYSNGTGRIEVYGVLDDGYIRALYTDAYGSGYLAVTPQMIYGNELQVFVQPYGQGFFNPNPLIWQKQ